MGFNLAFKELMPAKVLVVLFGKYWTV